MRKSVIVIFLLLAMVFSTSLLAGAASSDPLEVLREQEGVVEEIVSLFEQNNDEVALEKLDSLHSVVIETSAILKGWKFEGEKGPKLTNPFELPGGVYRVHFTTQGFGQVKVIPVKEDSWEMLFNLSPGQASDGASVVYRSEGREVMVQFSNVSKPYKLVFEKLG